MSPALSEQSGFTLIEALAAIVIVSIGLLGLLALQTFAITATQSSQYKTIASIGVADIAGRIQANPAGAAQHDYDTIDNPRTKPSADCRGNQCTPEQMAAYDAWAWNQSLADALPDGHGYVDCAKHAIPGDTSTVCAVYTVTVAWDARDLKNQPPDDSKLTCADTRHDIQGACIVAEVGP